ncbi:MAG: hypothetical protein AAGC77_07225 [Pseudomonadota bacterium]
MKTPALISVIAIMALSACGGDPSERAAGALESANAKWQEATENMNPVKRVSEYEDIIEDLEAIVEDYPETPVGQSLAAGQSVSGLSLARVTQEKDRLAERASCYASPTVECLLPLTSAVFQEDGSAVSGSAGNVAVVCSDGFDAALTALESKRINARLYADELVQVGFAAAACDKPDLVERAITAYVEAEPTSMSNRANRIAQIPNTPDLKDGWGPAIAELETLLSVEAMPANTKATIALTLVNAYSRMNEPTKAVAKYEYVTKDLGFRISNTLETGGNLIAGGAVDEGVNLAKATSGQPRFEEQRAITHLWRGLQFMTDNLGLSKNNGRVDFRSIAMQQTIAEYFAAPADNTAAATRDTLAKIQALMDGFDASAWRKDSTEQRNAIGAYSYIGLIHQKLGDEEAALAALDKADEIAAQMSTATGTPSPTADYRFLLAMADNDLEIMRVSALSNTSYGSHHIPQFVKAAVAADEIELAITTMAEASPNDAGAYYYNNLIREMIDQEKIDQLEAVIDASPQDARTKASYATQAIQAYAEQGMPDKVEALKAKYHPNPTANLEQALSKSLIKAHAKAGNDSRVKSMIGELFERGLASDENAPQFGNNRFYAQESAIEAFELGYLDYGLELYGKAVRKDQWPLTRAIASEGFKERDLPRVLMIGYDSVNEAGMQIITNYAVGYLRG